MKLSIAGIDLGTTNSVITIINENGQPETVLNKYKKTITPSIIYFNPEPVVGEEAREMQAMGEKNIAAFFKRNMGDPNFVLNYYEKDYTPIDLSALVLKKLKNDAESYTNSIVSDVVITVPAYFNELQRKNTLQAGEMAGFSVLRIINEPTAAALGYGVKNLNKPQINLIFDLGGGTFDISIVKLTKNNIEVLATDGDHHLGGKDWDDRIASYIAQQFEEKLGLNPLQDSDTYNDFLVRVENAKKTLSNISKITIPIYFKGKKETFVLTRAKFKDLTSDLLERTIHITNQTLEVSGLSWHDISGILLVGGSTRMPMVYEYVKEKLGLPVMSGVNVDEVVSRGAALQAAMDIQTNEKTFYIGPSVKDVMSHSMGVVAINKNRSQYINSIIIPKNRQIPCVEQRPFQLQTYEKINNSLEVYMTQGESDLPLECTILGKYSFFDIPHAKNGIAIVNISYEYDKNGMVQVSAIDKESEKVLPMKIEPVPDDISWLSLPPENDCLADNHICIYLCIDASGSMYGSPIDEAKKAAVKFVEKCDLSKMSIGITSFNYQASIVLNACQNAKKIERAISQIEADGGTNMTDAIELTYKELKCIEGARFIVLLSDGMPNSPDTAEMAAKECHQDNINIITIGTGDANKGYLNKLASCEEANIFATSGNLVKTFSKIAQVLTETGGGIQLSDAQPINGIFERLHT